jgi:multidrug efflux pump
MIIKSENGRTIRFSDVGYAELGVENERSNIQRSTIPGVLVSIQPQPNANEIAISNEIYKRLDGLRAEVPKDITIDIAMIIQSLSEGLFKK